MSLSKQTAQAILSIFETGHAQGDPSAVAILPDGAGISYGMHQGTDRSGTLDAILARYKALGGPWAATLDGYAPALTSNLTASVDPTRPPQWVRDLMGYLRAAGKCPLMRQAQQEVFDELYWVPAVAQAKKMGLVTPLALAVVYDTCVQSGPAGVGRIRKKFRELPPSLGGSEKAWVKAYVTARYHWLAGSRNRLVRASVYRMIAFQGLIRNGKWALETPLKVRGQLIS